MLTHPLNTAEPVTCPRPPSPGGRRRTHAWRRRSCWTRAGSTVVLRSSSWKLLLGRMSGGWRSKLSKMSPGGEGGQGGQDLDLEETVLRRPHLS